MRQRHKDCFCEALRMVLFYIPHQFMFNSVTCSQCLDSKFSIPATTNVYRYNYFSLFLPHFNIKESWALWPVYCRRFHSTKEHSLALTYRWKMYDWVGLEYTVDLGLDHFLPIRYQEYFTLLQRRTVNIYQFWTINQCFDFSWGHQ